MQIKFSDNTTLDVLNVNGQAAYYQGANRDSLEFQFAKSAYGFDQLEGIFADESKTGQITIIDDAAQYLHENYCLRMKMELRPVEITPASGSTPAVTDERICITMAQKAYAEIQMKTMQDTVDMLVLSSL